jgi:hypothetical protein
MLRRTKHYVRYHRPFLELLSSLDPDSARHDQVAKRLRDIPAKSRGGDSYEGILATSDYHLSIVALVGRLQSARVLNRGGSTICWEAVLNNFKGQALLAPSVRAHRILER